MPFSSGSCRIESGLRLRGGIPDDNSTRTSKSDNLLLRNVREGEAPAEPKKFSISQPRKKLGAMHASLAFCMVRAGILNDFSAGEFNVEMSILQIKTTGTKSKESKGFAEKSKRMTTIVGIFDDAWNVEKAVEQVAAAGFEDAVYDEAIVAEQPGSAGAIPFRAPGSAPEKVLGSDAPNLLSKPDWNTIVQAFKAQLGHYHLSSEVIRGYATAFLHNGKFLLVRTDAERAEQAMKILRDCGATRVNRHG